MIRPHCDYPTGDCVLREHLREAYALVDERTALLEACVTERACLRERAELAEVELDGYMRTAASNYQRVLALEAELERLRP